MEIKTDSELTDAEGNSDSDGGGDLFTGRVKKGLAVALKAKEVKKERQLLRTGRRRIKSQDDHLEFMTQAPEIEKDDANGLRELLRDCQALPAERCERNGQAIAAAAADEDSLEILASQNNSVASAGLLIPDDSFYSPTLDSPEANDQEQGRRDRDRGKTGRGRVRSRGRGEGSRSSSRGKQKGKGGRGRPSDGEEFEKMRVKLNGVQSRVAETEVLIDTEEVEDCDFKIFEPEGVEGKKKEQMMVKMKFQGNVYKMQMGVKETFWAKLDLMTRLLKIKERHSIVLSYNSKIISFDESPLSLNLSVVEILDCFVKRTDGTEGQEVEDPNLITVIFRDHKAPKQQQMVPLRLNPAAPFTTVMVKYALIKGVPLEKITFEFDAESLSASDTPLGLDMDSESLVDVKIKP